MEVARLGVKSKLQLPVYTTVTATRDPSRVCDLPHSLWQLQIFNQLNKARPDICTLMDTSQVLNPLSHNRNSSIVMLRWIHVVWISGSLHPVLLLSLQCTYITTICLSVHLLRDIWVISSSGQLQIKPL